MVEPSRSAGHNYPMNTEFAAKSRDMIAKKMTPAQIAEAQRLATASLMLEAWFLEKQVTYFHLD